jgi:hypothetical protein
MGSDERDETPERLPAVDPLLILFDLAAERVQGIPGAEVRAKERIIPRAAPGVHRNGVSRRRRRPSSCFRGRIDPVLACGNTLYMMDSVSGPPPQGIGAVSDDRATFREDAE